MGEESNEPIVQIVAGEQDLEKVVVAVEELSRWLRKVCDQLVELKVLLKAGPRPAGRDGA